MRERYLIRSTEDIDERVLLLITRRAINILGSIEIFLRSVNRLCVCISLTCNTISFLAMLLTAIHSADTVVEIYKTLLNSR